MTNERSAPDEDAELVEIIEKRLTANVVSLAAACEMGRGAAAAKTVAKRIAASIAERISSRDDGLLAWLADNPALELSWQEVGGDLSECAWHVHRCHGGRNDREWEAIAYAETPKRALELARATSSGARE